MSRGPAKLAECIASSGPESASTGSWKCLVVISRAGALAADLAVAERHTGKHRQVQSRVKAAKDVKDTQQPQLTTDR